MTIEWTGLYLGAAATGVIHTLLGPDHYVPFVALSRARNWSTPRTVTLTTLCGVGHVAGSIVLGAIGIAMGLGVKSLTAVESVRGDVAGWMLIAFGMVYMIWGIKKAGRIRAHVHEHVHVDGTVHLHEHHHHHAHVHVHAEGAKLTPWVLFLVFVFGPCEPLIPFLMYPAATSSGLGTTMVVAAVFAVATIATMLTTVLLLRAGMQFGEGWSGARFGHALAGAVILACGVAVQLGL